MSKKVGTNIALIGILCVSIFMTGFNGCDPFFTVPTSLHTTFAGMRGFYVAESDDDNFSGSDGYQHITCVSYDDLACKKCHDKSKPDEPDANNCNNCHTDLVNYKDEIANETCLGCHSRQGKEAALEFTDVHSSEYPNCVDCHTLNEVHGNGMVYQSMWEEGATETTCESCHTGANPAGTAISDNHDAHSGKLHCSACHVKSVVTCYNCHFDSEVNGTGKIAHKAIGSNNPEEGWVFLVNHDNQVRTANFQSLVYEGGNTFIAFAPFHSHSVTKEKARTCSDCHNNASMKELETNGKIVVTSWDEETDTVKQNAKGAIPVVDGKMEFIHADLVDVENKTWSLIGDTTENVQYGYCTPLTDAQISMLAMDLGSLKQYIINNQLMDDNTLETLKIK